MADETTGDTQDTQEKKPLSEAQQKMVDKLMGDLRIEVREKTLADAKTAQEQSAKDAERDRMAAEKEWEKLATMHSDRVKELEPFEVEAMAYRAMVADLLKDRVKELGDKAKVAIKALPESMSDLEKLNWLNKVASEGAFATEGSSRVGTPAARKKLQRQGEKSPADLGHRRLRL